MNDSRGSGEVLLKVERLSKAFGGIQAVRDVSFTLSEGEIVGLIGPNGAGKTTLVNLVTGVFPASSGTVVFRGSDITRQRPFQAARRGIARTFQIVQPFPAMTVLENVVAGALFAGGAADRATAENEAMAHLEFVGLGAEALRPAASLTLPSRKRLELGGSGRDPAASWPGRPVFQRVGRTCPAAFVQFGRGSWSCA